MPRKPIGKRPMTDAERQARCRAARESGTPAVRIWRPLDHRSRAKRWRDAVSELTTLQGPVYRLAGSSAGEPTGQRHRRGVAGDLRPRPH